MSSIFPGFLAAISSAETNPLSLTLSVHLPPIKLSFNVPLLPGPKRKIRILVHTTVSELVFKTLEISSACCRAIDVGRKPISVKASGVRADFKGSFGVQATITLEPIQPAPSGDAKTSVTPSRQWKWKGSGRVDAEIDKSAMDLDLLFVQGRKSRNRQTSDSKVDLKGNERDQNEEKKPIAAARLAVLSSSFDEGLIHRANIQGFGIWGSITTKALPWVRGTVLVRWPVKVVGDFLVREIVEGGVLDVMLKDAWATGGQHVDIDTYSSILDADRDTEIDAPLDASRLAPPSAASSSPSPKPNPVDTEVAAPENPIATAFRLHSNLIGPTKLQNFPLPDFEPPLYRPGGTRAALQSFNLLTSELQLKFYDSAFQSITFDRAALAFDPSRPGAGDLVVTVDQLVVILAGKFKVHTDLTSLVAWTTGMKRIGQRGSSTTTVRARSLQIRFGLHQLSPKVRKERGGFPYELRESAMSPFTSIEPRFEMESSFLKLGADLVNAITAGLKVSPIRLYIQSCGSLTWTRPRLEQTQIAQAASLVVKRGMQDVVRKNLQAALDGIEETLREAGVELPVNFRASGADSTA